MPATRLNPDPTQVAGISAEVPMTHPHQRPRAVVQTREFLVER